MAEWNVSNKATGKNSLTKERFVVNWLNADLPLKTVEQMADIKNFQSSPYPAGQIKQLPPT